MSPPGHAALGDSVTAVTGRAGALTIGAAAVYLAVAVGAYGRTDAIPLLTAAALGLAAGGLLWVDGRAHGRALAHLVGAGATALVGGALRVDGDTWFAPAFLLAWVTVAFAYRFGWRDALVQAALAAALLWSAAAEHMGRSDVIVVSVLFALSLIGIVRLAVEERRSMTAEAERERDALLREAEAREGRLRASESRYRHLVEALPLVTYVTSLDDGGRTLYVSPHVEQLTGRGVGQWMDEPDLWASTVHPEDRDRVLAERRHHLDTGRPLRSEYRLRTADGSELWVLDEAVTETDDTGAPVQSRGYLQDITERKELEAQLAYRALHDPLTGLQNRVLVLERLQHWASRRHPQPLAVLYVDLDDFKAINDELGHAAGDAVLIDVASRISSCLRPEDTIGRIGGDEFAMLVEGVEHDDAVQIGERVLAAIGSEPVVVEGKDVMIGASVGIAFSTRGTAASEALLNRADIAMYEAKAAGKGQVATYAAEMGTDAVKRQRMRGELNRALEQEEFDLHYQTIVAVPGGKPVGVEALLRWNHPTHGLVRPPDFIDIAVATGQIVPIGRWGLDRACAAAAELRNATGEPLFVTFNLSLRELHAADVVERVRGAVARHGLPPDALMLEITEGAFLPDEHPTTRRLEALRAIGVQLAIDDFGTGYSSLSYLTRVPADVVKLARQFVVALEHEGRQAALARAVIHLCSDLGLRTVGEGVETEEQLALLGELGCDLAQGYLFSKPIPFHRLLWQLAPDTDPGLRSAAVG